MNKRLEEKLAMLAFGDMTPEEMSRLEREVAGDPEARGILESYRGIRSGLRAMGAQVPEHQLSTDRLRHAILAQGLKPKAAGRSIGWLWMPTAVVILAFGAVMFKNSRQVNVPMQGTFGSGVVVADNRMDRDFTLPDIRLPNVDPVSNLSLPSDPPSAKSQASAVRAAPRLASRHVRSSDHSKVARLKEAVSEQLDQKIIALSNRAADMGLSKSLGAEAPIVLIGNMTDDSTGAKQATEVDSASNVLVGG